MRSYIQLNQFSSFSTKELVRNVKLKTLKAYVNLLNSSSAGCLPKWSERLQLTPCALSPNSLRNQQHHHHHLSPSLPANSIQFNCTLQLALGHRFFKMRFSATTLLVTALGWVSAATAHTIQLKAHSRECFHETLHRDDLMTVTFQVGDREFGGSGNLEIDFWVGLRGVLMAPLVGGLEARALLRKKKHERCRTGRTMTCKERTKLMIFAILGRGSSPQPPIL